MSPQDRKIIYQTWKDMHKRAYSFDYHETHPTYIGCSVTEEWGIFQNFVEWAEKQIGCLEKGYQLDKDILNRGNKIYCPKFCCFVPQEINKLLKPKKKNKELPLGVMNCRDKFIAMWYEFGKLKYSKVFSDPTIAFNVYKENKERTIKEVAEIWRDKIDLKVYEALMNYKIKGE